MALCRRSHRPPTNLHVQPVFDAPCSCAQSQTVVTNVDDADIDRETFDRMMRSLDKDGDGHVTKDEFKIPCASAYLAHKSKRAQLSW